MRRDPGARSWCVNKKNNCVNVALVHDDEQKDEDRKYSPFSFSKSVFKGCVVKACQRYHCILSPPELLKIDILKFTSTNSNKKVSHE